MTSILSQSELIKKSNNSKIAFWGEGYIAAKTFEKTKVIPNIIFDNNPDISNQKQFGVTIYQPNKNLLNQIDYIIITSTSILEIANQLKFLGFNEEKIFVSPVLKDVFNICKFESQSFDILFSSGLQNASEDKIIGGGGLYRIKGSFDDFKLTKLISGSTHGILKRNEEIFVVNEKNGICKLDQNLNIIEKHPIPKGYRAHGIDYSKKFNCWVLACAHYDGILILDSTFKLKDNILFSKQKSYYDNIAQHHCNDICILNNYAYVSMFSLTGNYKRGIYDGGVMVFDLETKKAEKNLYGELLMPHNILFKENSFWILDSLRGFVLNGTDNKITRLPSFTRGFDILSNGHLLIGQSKNRNFSLLKNQSNNISLDTSIVVHDRSNSISKSIHLPSSVSEIHSIVDISEF